LAVFPQKKRDAAGSGFFKFLQLKIKLTANIMYKETTQVFPPFSAAGEFLLFFYTK